MGLLLVVSVFVGLLIYDGLWCGMVLASRIWWCRCLCRRDFCGLNACGLGVG